MEKGNIEKNKTELETGENNDGKKIWKIVYFSSLVVVLIVKVFLYATILKTDNWAEGNGSNFGVLNYCAHNETSCEKVTDKLHTIKGMIVQE